MNMHTIRRLAVAAIGGALLLAPTAAGGFASQASPQVLCPESAGAPCQKIGAQPGADRVRIRPLPLPTRGPNGRQMWRSGKWLMS
jgi:hypothetical protein